MSLAPKKVVLGFYEKAKSSVIMQPEFTPSKIGGDPAWIAPKGIPSQWCKKCEHKMSFLMQVYANITDPRHDDYHRMLYVFVCISEECIGTQNAFKVFRCMIPHYNQLIKFADDSEFDKIWGKTDNQLISMGYKIQKKDSGGGDQIDSSTAAGEDDEDLDEEEEKKSEAEKRKAFLRNKHFIF